MYESRAHPILSRALFAKRLLLHGAVAFSLVLVSLAIGMAGYEYFEKLPWRDAFLNTAMLLGGMGPLDPPRTDGGKLFAGIYALYAGLVFLITVGLLFAPLVHRMMHRFHWKDDRSP